MPTRTRARAVTAPSARQRYARARWGDLRFNGSARRARHGRPAARDRPAGRRPRRRRARTCAPSESCSGSPTRRSASSSWSASSPLGDGAAVLLRQRFGGAGAGVDGLVTVGVRDGQGAVRLVVADPRPGAPARGTRRRGAGRAGRRGRRGPHGLGRRPQRPPQGGRLERVHARGFTDLEARPDGRRAHARRRQPRRVRGRADRQRRRRSRSASRRSSTTHRRGPRARGPRRPARRQPHVGRVPEHPADRTTRSTDTRELWCWTAGAPGCDRRSAPTRRRRAWDVDAAHGAPTFTTRATTRTATEKWHTTTLRSRARTTPTSRHRDYAYPWTNQWFEEECNPTHVHVAAAQRHRRGDSEPVREAQPHARLVVQARLHRDHWNLQEVNFGRGGGEQRPRARQRPGRRHRRRPAGLRVARQRQPDHAAGRHGAGHQHVPLAADRRRVLRALRRRRLRHVGDRPRVQPRDLQPDGRRSGQPPRRAPRRTRWARAGRT